MENHDSSWYIVEHVPANYIFPQELRPGKLFPPLYDSIPVIDLGKAMSSSEEHIHTVQRILKAAQEFGFFQVINHGVPERVIQDTMGVFREFFDMAAKDRAGTVTNDWLYTSSIDFAKDGVHLWRDNIKHPCQPLEECVQLWPTKPATYREVVMTYLVEIRKLSLRILEFIGEGLGLEKNYFSETSEIQLLSANNYPPCPDPSLTLGILKHCDPSLITILFQSVCGLQVLKDGQWISIGALPNAFVVNIGNQLEIISNGKLKSAEHRAVTNLSEVRASIATFITPSPECIVEPAKVLINELNPPRYGSTLFKEFVNSSKAFGPKTDVMDGAVSELLGTWRIGQEERPGELVPVCDSIPVIDLEKGIGNPEERSCTAQQIVKAAQEFGFFQVINHEIPENIVYETVRVLRDFFDMASKDKASVPPNTKGWMYGSSNVFAKNGVHLWRENIKQSCHPLEECMLLWPEKPTTYQEVVATYLVEIRKLSLRILDLIAEGLGLDPGYFKETSEVQLMTVNSYPPCPNPSLTLGLLRHNDPSLITILFQSTSGLQVLKDGQWIGVGAIPNALVVNIGNQLEIISNGKLKSAEHRAVTNSSEVRTSIATFISPSPDCIVGPAKVLVNEQNPARYDSILYKDFVYSSKAFGSGSEKDKVDIAVLKLIR